jgi:DNA-binding transcriptional LysR family regulator
VPTFDPEHSDRTFKVLISEFTTAVLMPKVLQLAWQQAKGISFELQPQTSEPERVLARGDSDLLLIPDNYLTSSHPSEILFEENYVCVIWNENSIIGESISLDEYVAASHIAVQYGDDRVPAFEGWFMKRFGVVRKIQVFSHNLLAPADLVVGTDRIATMHSRAAHRAARTLPIRILPSPIEIPTLKLAMQWHQYRSGDPGLKWLRDLMHQAATDI